MTAGSDRGRPEGRHGGPPRVEGPTPLVAWAAGAWIGALAGWAVAAPGATRTLVLAGTAIAGLVVALVAVAAIGRRVDAGSARGGASRRLVHTWLGLVLVVAVSAGAAQARATTLDRGPLARLAQQGGGSTMLVTVASEPALRDDGTSWVLVTVTRVGHHHGRWRALVAGLRDPPTVGDRLRATATARPLDHDGFEGSLRRRHAGVALDADTWLPVAPAGGVLGAIDALRTDVRDAARAGLSGDRAALATGLVTGDVRGLSAAADDGMRATGLTHLVAVSGSNVALVLGVVAAVARRWPRRLRRAALATALVAFTLTTRVEPSVLRAATMAGVVLAADLRGVPPDAVHALAGTVLVLVLVDPASAGTLGLVLSALATAGVLVAAPALARRLPRRLPRAVRLLLAATLGAQVAVAPVLLATVGEVPLVSIPANLVAVPAAAVAAVVATVAAVAAPLLPGVAAVVFGLADLPLRVVLAVAAHLRGPAITPDRPVLAVVAVVVAVALLARRGGRLRRVAVVAVVLAGVAFGPPATWVGARLGWGVPDVLSVTAIDVGQGDAILVTTSSGHRMLVDAGGDDAAATWLRRHGIGRLDLVVVTHPHADHVGGLPDVVARVDVDRAWVAAEPDGSAPTLDRVATIGGSRPVGWPDTTTVGVVRAGSALRLGSATVEVLGPPTGPDLAATEGAANDRSVVLRVVEDDRVALLVGDAEVAAQRWLLEHVHDLRAGLLKVPHHGAATTEPAFLDAVAPRVGLVSVGRDNDYGHPHPRLLGWLDDLDVVVHRTDHDGTVTLPVPPPRPDAGAGSAGLPQPAAMPGGGHRPRAPRDLSRGRRTGRSRARAPRWVPAGRPVPGRCRSSAAVPRRSCRPPRGRGRWSSPPGSAVPGPCSPPP